jgi:ribosomal protein S2
MLYCVVGVRDKYVIFNAFFIVLVCRFCMLFFFKLVRYAWGEFLFVNCDPAMRFYIRSIAFHCGASVLVDRRFFGLLSNFRSYAIKFLRDFSTGGGSSLMFLTRLPSVVFISSVLWSPWIISESRWLQIPVIGIVDSNCSGLFFSFPIPGNDDSISSIVFLSNVVAYMMLICRFRVMKWFI